MYIIVLGFLFEKGFNLVQIIKRWKQYYYVMAEVR